MSERKTATNLEEKQNLPKLMKNKNAWETSAVALHCKMSHTAPRPVPSTSQLPNTHTASTSATLPPDPVGSGRHAATMAPSSGIQPSSAASFQIVVSGQLEACQVNTAMINY